MGAERTRRLESTAIRSRTEPQLVPYGTTHAVDAETGEVLCAIDLPLTVFRELDWEAASMVEKCATCKNRARGSSTPP